MGGAARQRVIVLFTLAPTEIRGWVVMIGGCSWSHQVPDESACSE